MCLETSESLANSLLRLVQRSAFCITVVIMVVSQIHDGSGPQSLLTKRCRQQAEHMGKGTASSWQASPVDHANSQSDALLACVCHRNSPSYRCVTRFGNG